KFLIEQGANVNVKDNYGRTPLGEAAWPGHLNVVKWLIELGEDVNTKDNDGTAPLALAADFGKVNAAQILLEYGADINAQNTKSMTVLNWAMQNSHLEFAAVLLDHDNIHVSGLSDHQKYELIYIIEYHPDSAGLLIDKLFPGDQLELQIESYARQQ
ncbi:unnamed protein product, partial [Sphagnum jensenii]